jgi:hypothetical protein
MEPRPFCFFSIKRHTPTDAHHLELVEGLDGLAGSGKHAEDVEADLK